MHRNEIIYALICINNDVLSFLISMLSRGHERDIKRWVREIEDREEREREEKEGWEGEREHKGRFRRKRGGEDRAERSRDLGY